MEVIVVDKQKVLIFIDAPNFNGMQNDMGIAVNHAAFRDILTGDRERVAIRYYAQQPAVLGTRNFLKYLQGIGYEVVTAQTGEDVDDLIVGDIRRMYSQADVIVLVGGDAIYAEPLTEVAEAGKRVEVICTTTSLAGDFSKIAETIDPYTFKGEITDEMKTRQRRLQREIANGTVATPGAQQIGQLMALGSKVIVETRPQEIIIRIRLPQVPQ